MNQEIVYTGDNCGDMTKEDVMSDINLWIRETEEFAHLNEAQLTELKEKVYEQLLDRLEWQTPYTMLLEYDEDDMAALLALFN